MLSVIVDARSGSRKLPALLAQLTAGAVDGLVREVLILAPPGEAMAAICEDTGAERFDDLAAACRRARSERLMVLPEELRLRDGWIGSINDHLAAGGEAALVEGLSKGGLFRRGPYGVLTRRDRALEGADLHVLRRRLGLRPNRVG